MSPYVYRGTNRDVDAPTATVAEPPTPAPKPKPNAGCGTSYGTNSGYKRHKKAGEVACDACKAAVAAYAKEYRAKVRSGERFIRKGFSTERCGSYAGYIRHNRHSVPACKPCLKAYGAYMSEWRTRRKAAA